MNSPNCYRILLLSLSLFILPPYITASPNRINKYEDSTKKTTKEQALTYLSTIKKIDSSEFWPNIDPALLLANLNFSIAGPLRSFEGKNTNFCAYTAVSYITMQDDPLGFVQFILELYKYGKARMGKKTLSPSARVRHKAGLIKYKGQLDINHLAQMWFLTLADQFKGYLNFFNKRYNDEDESRMWAATNYAKFNKMLRKLFPYKKVKPKGSDLIRPSLDSTFTYLKKALKKGVVFLYLNNRLLYKKKHDTGRFGIPTHFVVLIDAYRIDDAINIVYWDAGRKTLQQVSEVFLKKIIYGITICYDKPTNR